MQPTRSTSRATTRQADHTAVIAFLIGTLVMMAGMWRLQDGQPGVATPAGIISSQP